MPISILIGIILSVISTMLIAVLLFKKKEPFFNFREILKDHFSLFAKCKSQYVVFYFLPLLLSVGLTLLFTVNSSFFSHLGVVLSIILSMMLALLAILCDYDFSKFMDDNQRNNAETSVKQTINAIMFCCIIGIILLLEGFIVIAMSGKTYDWFPFDLTICKIIVSACSYYLLIIVFLNLLLIIKNISKIIEARMMIERDKK